MRPARGCFRPGTYSPPVTHLLPPIPRTHCGAPSPQRPFSLIVQRGQDVIMVRRVGLLGLAGARMCPNLLQRRLGPGSAARRSAEYQRFSSRTPMESRPLQQIWTTGATADLSEAAGVAPPDRKVIHRAVMRVRDGGARDRRRAHGGALPLGPLTFRWTTCVRLDHLNAVGPSGSRNTVVQPHIVVLVQDDDGRAQDHQHGNDRLVPPCGMRRARRWTWFCIRASGYGPTA